jgi:hypothetical protein
MDTLPPIDDSILNEPEIREQPSPSAQEPQYVYVQPPQWDQQSDQFTKKDIFSDLDKTAYIIIFIAFILGFFMGKTMQPVILRHS